MRFPISVSSHCQPTGFISITYWHKHCTCTFVITAEKCGRVKKMNQSVKTPSVNEFYVTRCSLMLYLRTCRQDWSVGCESEGLYCYVCLFVHWEKMNRIILIRAEHIVSVQTVPGGNSYAPLNSVFDRQLWFSMISSPPVWKSIIIRLEKAVMQLYG